MHCISIVSYSTLNNRATHGCINPLYIFLLCVEGFLRLINEALQNQILCGISICRGCPYSTHIFFTNDNILFCRTRGQECQELKEILEVYEVALRQKINTDKSLVFFSHNAHKRKGRVEKKLIGWKEKLLSMRGREILI